MSQQPDDNEHIDTSNWKRLQEYGLDVAGNIRPSPSLAEAVRMFRQYLINNGPKVQVVTRRILADDWQVYTHEASRTSPSDIPSRPRQRQFTKDTAPKPVSSPPKKVVKTVNVERNDDDPTISKVLFESPTQQLRYEVQHWYLYTVPPTQREQWPMGNYGFTERFIDDVYEQSRQISRSQIIAAIVDVVCGRHVEVPARSSRAMRDGGGAHARPQVARTDGALAWRANVNTGTPAARRIMWWRLPDGRIELARLATHDDVDLR